jgi:hypothetical protein
MLCILPFLSGCCSETEVSEQLYYACAVKRACYVSKAACQAKPGKPHLTKLINTIIIKK